MNNEFPYIHSVVAHLFYIQLSTHTIHISFMHFILPVAVPRLQQSKFVNKLNLLNNNVRSWNGYCAEGTVAIRCSDKLTFDVCWLHLQKLTGRSQRTRITSFHRSCVMTTGTNKYGNLPIQQHWIIMNELRIQKAVNPAILLSPLKTFTRKEMETRPTLKTSRCADKSTPQHYGKKIRELPL